MKEYIKLPQSYTKWCPSNVCGRSLSYHSHTKKPYVCSVCHGRWTKDQLVKIWRNDNE